MKTRSQKNLAHCGFGGGTLNFLHGSGTEIIWIIIEKRAKRGQYPTFNTMLEM